MGQERTMQLFDIFDYAIPNGKKGDGKRATQLVTAKQH